MAKEQIFVMIYFKKIYLIDSITMYAMFHATDNF